jgi:Bacterial SH3 domain
MEQRHFYRFGWVFAIFIFILTATGCGNFPVPGNEPTPSAAPIASESPATELPEASPTASPVSETESDPNILYQDDFTDPATSWPEAKFDNYFIGYHEPEYYHVELSGPNYKTTVFEPDKRSFDDATVELQVLTNSTKTAGSGDFRYGSAFRRSGDQYYAFTISPRAKKWFLLKSSPTALTVLAEGTDENIHDLDMDDLLRVDAQGPNFTLYINDQYVGQATDPDYSTGEIGFYVESFDSPNTHIHFDTLVIRNLEAPLVQEPGVTLLYQDDFTNPATSWPERKFDNYFIGYHEPEYYHIELTGPSYKTTVFEPQKRSFDDFTAELDVLTASGKTAPEGDFRYGLAFRRSGDAYYAFTISPRSKKWYVLKSSPSGLAVLTEGTEENIHDLDADDRLRVDAHGPNFLFHINDKLVGQATDPDYADGEVGFYVESFDSAATHIHFDTLTIRNFEVSLLCNVNALALNVRSGPSTTFSSNAFLSTGDTIEPLGLSPDGEWIKIKMEGNEEGGWVFNSPTFVSCNADVGLLPVVKP